MSRNNKTINLHLDFGTRTLKYVAGNLMSGTDVRNVQTRLKFSAYNPGPINGIYNAEMKRLYANSRSMQARSSMA